MKKPKKISGTREWAVSTINICDGCTNGCRYCYARQMAVRFGRIKCDKEWEIQTIRDKEFNKSRTKRQGTIMFPSAHDISEETLPQFMEVLGKLLRAGNTVLVVSKPKPSYITAICKRFEAFKSTLLFRFTIGAYKARILEYWDPHAPTYRERLQSLQVAFKNGFNTSVSVEPMLDSFNVEKLFYKLEPFVTDTIWIGKLNKIRERVHIETDEDEKQVAKIEAGQTDERVQAIYAALKDEPKIRWKESFKEVLGLETATEAGLDV